MNLQRITRVVTPLILCMLLAGYACTNDEEFASNVASIITFSSDTISFDTIFTDFGSATKEFKIYNPSSKGVRLSSIRLASGGSSGFRINLDGQHATQFNDVEIYHGDSLFCFVEVTVDPHDSDSPILITDSLLFSIESGRTFKVLLQAWGQDVVLMHAPYFVSSDTLSARRPIVIMDSLVVGPDATLTIAAGTTLCFHKGAGLAVHGKLNCQGTMEAPIIMRGDRTDKLFPYLPYDRLDAQWQGIHLYPESVNNRFCYCNIHGGNYGIEADSTNTDETKCEIINSIIHNVAGVGLYLHGARAKATGCQISNAMAGCLAVIGGETLFTHCTIAQFYPWSADYGPALYFANVANNTIFPLHMIEFRNCIITGYSNDEVYGTRMDDSDADFNYMFRNCLVNTKISDDDQPYFINCLFDQDDKKKDSSASDETDIPLRESNFVLLDTHNFSYDFALDSLSVARRLGNAEYISDEAQYDLRGIKRPAEYPDAGCYQSPRP